MRMITINRKHNKLVKNSEENPIIILEEQDEINKYREPPFLVEPKSAWKFSTFELLHNNI